MSHLEENARLSHELQEALDKLAGVTAQRDELKRQLTNTTKLMQENSKLRKECQRLSEIIDELKERLILAPRRERSLRP